MCKEEDMFQQKKQLSVQNRQQPMAFVQDYFHGYYYNNSFYEFIEFYRKHVVHNSMLSDDFLFCLEQVVAHTPKNLIESLYQSGIAFFHNDKNETDWTFAEYIDWLKRLHGLLTRIKANPEFNDYEVMDFEPEN